MESYSQAPRIVLRKVQSKFEGVGGSLKLFEKWLCIKKNFPICDLTGMCFVKI